MLQKEITCCLISIRDLLKSFTLTKIGARFCISETEVEGAAVIKQRKRDSYVSISHIWKLGYSPNTEPPELDLLVLPTSPSPLTQRYYNTVK